MPTNDDRHTLVDLLPRYLTVALRGWSGLTTLLDSRGLDRPASFLLRALIQERDAGAGMTEGEMQTDLFNPYSTIRPILDALPALVERGDVAQEGSRYTVTAQGWAVTEEIEAAKHEYLVTLAPIGAADLARLAERLMTIAAALWEASAPSEKPHQARAWRAMPPAETAPMVRLYGAVYALWMARDDAHNATWRAAGFDGPAFDLLSRVWSGDARSVTELTTALQQFQRPEDVTRGITSLTAAGYLARDGDELQLTPHGQETRDAIEAETDRLYFAAWPPRSSGDIGWLRETLESVVAGLPS